jgi:hypothetical protein
MRRRTQLIITVVILAIAALGFLIWSANRGITSPMFRHPEENAYDALIFAEKQLGDFSPDPTSAKLAQSVTNNAEALRLMRAALERPFEAPESTYDNQLINAVLGNVGRFKTLALAARCAGALAEQNGDFPSAARSYLDIIRLGQKIQAGPLIFMLIGVSIERLGVEAMEKLEPNLTGGFRAEIATTLKQLNETRLPFEEVQRREQYLRRRASPTPLHYIIFTRHVRAAMESGKQKHALAWQSLDAIASKLAQPTPRTPTAAPGE